VPGHENHLTYRIYPDTYTASNGKIEIFPANAQGEITGNAVYSTTAFDKAGGADRTFTYSGTDINWQVQYYVFKLSVGEHPDSFCSDSQHFSVEAYGLYYFFWDVLDNGYASGVDKDTVNTQKVSVSCWYWDETEASASSVNLGDIDLVENMSQELLDELDITAQEKDWYVERGSVYVEVAGDFYATSEQDQYFYLKIAVSTGGVLDNAENPYDANTATEDIENTVTYKLRISSSGSLSILETTYD